MSFLHLFVGLGACFTAYVHIGPHKCGSTQIQRGLVLNAELLWGAGGIRCLFCEHEKEGAKIPATISSNSKKPFLVDQNALTQLRKQTTNPSSDIILSAEGFCKFNITDVQVLRSMLHAFSNVTVIAFQRSFWPRLVSTWLQRSKQILLPRRLSDFALDVMQTESLTGDYLRHWSSVFGEHNVHILSFEGSVQRFGSPFAALLQFLNIDSHGFQYPPVMNKSPPTALIDCVRLISEYALLSKCDVVCSFCLVCA